MYIFIAIISLFLSTISLAVIIGNLSYLVYRNIIENEK